MAAIEAAMVHHMPEFFRSLASRLREYVGDRRHTERHHVRLPASVSLIQKTRKVNGGAAPELPGYTRDISNGGLAIVVPAIHLEGHHLVGEGRTLLIKLQLPEDTIHFQATPVRYERLDEEESDSGYLIGMRITDMDVGDRAHFDDYIERAGEK